MVIDGEGAIGLEGEGAESLRAVVGVDFGEVEGEGGASLWGARDGEDGGGSRDELEVVVEGEGVVSEVVETEELPAVAILVFVPEV